MTDLVERVARAIATEFESPGANLHDWTGEARAAIRVVVEECVQKVAHMPVFSGDKALRACEQATILDAADAIRALLEDGK